MNVAIVGCGKIAQAHIAAIRTVPGIKLVAVCDQDRYVAEDTAYLLDNVHAYDDVADMLEREQPEVVHILTPPATHFTLARQALEAGCHALVEKPMALSAEQAQSLVDCAAQHGVQVGVVHNYLYKPSVLKARSLIERGAIGDVVYVYNYYGLAGEGGAYLGSAGHYHWAWQLPGGPFTNFLPHVIYLQQAFLGKPLIVEGVSLTGADGGPKTELSVLTASSDVSGTMTVSMRAKPYAKFVDVYGTEGFIHVDLVREVCTLHRERHAPRMVSKVAYNLEDITQLITGTGLNIAKVGLGKMKNMPEMQRFVGEFYEHIQEGTPVLISGQDGLAVVEMMERIWAQVLAPAQAPSDTVRAPFVPTPRNATERKIVESAALNGKKVLVTGATGFLGHRLVSALWRCGANVVALVRDPLQVATEINAQATIMRGNLRDVNSLRAAMQDVDVVFHCAAVTSNNVSWRTHDETNIRGTEAVLAAALETGVKRVVYASSVIVYGLNGASNGRPVDESFSVRDPADVWAYYPRSKYAAEAVAVHYWRDCGLPVSVLRLGILYGPGGRPAGRALIELGALRFVVGSGRNHLPYTYIDNAVDAMLLAAVASEPLGDIYTIVDTPQPRAGEVIRKAAAVAGKRVILMPIPPAALYAAARWFEWQARRQHSDVAPKLTHYVIRSACRNVLYDSTKAQVKLGWVPEVSLDDGLQRTAGAQRST